MSYREHHPDFRKKWPKERIPKGPDRFRDEDYEEYVVDSTIDCIETLRVHERICAIGRQYELTFAEACLMYNNYLLLSLFTVIDKLDGSS